MKRSKTMKRAALVLATVLAGPAWVAAQTPVDQKRPAAADGKVSIENMSGSVKVTGWDRAEVQVKGTVGSGGELSFDGSEKETTIEVEAEHGNPMGIKSDLEVFVPAGSSVVDRGLPGHDLGGRGHGLGVGRDRQRLDHPAGAAKAVELQSVNGDDRGDEGVRPRPGRGGQRHRDRPRRVGRARGLDRQRQAARGRWLVRPGQARVRRGEHPVRGGALPARSRSNR